MVSQNKKKYIRQGFTLIELLIVVGMIVIMIGAVIMFLNPFSQIQKSQDAKRKSDLSAIQKSLELYYQDTGRYPPSTLDFKISSNAQSIDWGAAWQPYMAKVPVDPVSTKRYVYFTPPAANGQTYYLYASLDRGAQDPQACSSGNACTSITGVGFPGSNACGGVCSFGVTSPNVTP